MQTEVIHLCYILSFVARPLRLVLIIVCVITGAFSWSVVSTLMFVLLNLIFWREEIPYEQCVWLDVVSRGGGKLVNRMWKTGNW